MIRNSRVQQYMSNMDSGHCIYIIKDNRSLYIIQDNRYRIPINVIITGQVLA